MLALRLLALVGLLLSCAGSALSADSASSPWADLAANTWVRVEPALSKRLVLQSRDEHAQVKEITSREPAFREYTSPIFGGGELIYFGGGHSGYYGNDVEIYDSARNIWRQAYAPKCPAKDDSTYYSGGSERSYVDPDTGACQPYVLHGYNRTAFDALSKRYVCTAMFPTEVTQDSQTKKWKLVKQAFSLIAFDTKTGRWEFLATMPPELTAGPTGLTYDPDLRGVVGFGDHTVFVFQNGRWSLIGKSEERLTASGGAASVYLPKQKAHLIAVLGHGGAKEQGHVVRYDMTDHTAQRVDSLPAELQKRLAPGTGGYNLALAYDSLHDKVVAMSTDAEHRPQTWIYATGDDTWEKLPDASTAPKLVGCFEPGRGRAPLVYDAAQNVFLLLFRKEQDAELWAYRYAALPKP